MNFNTIRAKSIYKLFSFKNIVLVLGIDKLDNLDKYRHLFPDSNFNCHTCDYSNTARTQSCVSCPHYIPCNCVQCVNNSEFLLNPSLTLQGTYDLKVNAFIMYWNCSHSVGGII